MATASVIIDEVEFPLDYHYSGTQWEHKQGQSQAYKGTLTVCHTEQQGGAFSSPPSFDISFFGTDIFIYGTLTSGVAVNYSIDQSLIGPMVFTTKTFGKPGVELWSLKDLSTTASHSLQIFPTQGDITIDYFTYTPTTFSSLMATDLVVDDQNPALKYSSGWKNTSNTEFSSGVPYEGTTTGTSTKGSTMMLNFVGSSVSVYGALQQVDGRLSASFSVDNGVATTYTPFNGSQTSTSSWQVAQQLFHQDLAGDAHSLLVTLDDVSGSQMLWLDSVVFEGTATTTIANAAGGSSGGSSGGGSTSNGLLPSASSSSGIHFPLPAIGGIAGGLLVLSFIIFLIRRRMNITWSPQLPQPIPPTNYPAPYQHPPVFDTPWQPPTQPAFQPPRQPYIPPPQQPPPYLPPSPPVPSQDGSQPSLSMPAVSLWRPPMQPSSSSQWESGSSMSNLTSQPSSYSNLLRPSEKGVVLEWQPTVRNPSSHSDGWTSSPQAQEDGRGSDAVFTNRINSGSGSDGMDGRNPTPPPNTTPSHAQEDGRG